jgi:hypothetical protein
MFRKNIIFMLVILSLLFNIQAGFTHGVEHINHDHASHESSEDHASHESSEDHESHESSEDHESHESSAECEDCLLNYNLGKSTDLSTSIDFVFSNHNIPNDNYLVSNSIAYTFVAYQSQAP